MPAFRGHDLSVEVGPFVNPIPIKTTDTAELERVLVAIRTDKVGLIERGAARWKTERDRWEYLAQGTLPNRAEVTLDVLGTARKKKASVTASSLTS